MILFVQKLEMQNNFTQNNLTNCHKNAERFSNAIANLFKFIFWRPPLRSIRAQRAQIVSISCNERDFRIFP